MVSIKMEVNFGECNYKYVEFTGNPHPCDDGIGGYEFWGGKGYDSRPYISCDDTIDWNRNLYTDIENAIIEKYLEENEEEIDSKLCKE